MDKIRIDKSTLKAIKVAGGCRPHGKTLADVPLNCILNLDEAATLMQYGHHSLRKHKNDPGMPPYYKKSASGRGKNGKIFYDKRDVLQWLSSFKVIKP